MNKQELLGAISRVKTELKDFQKATVENIFDKLYVENQNRHLVADEVGLGKTIVAKGLIAKAMEYHLNNDQSGRPFRVVYICSNQALTEQNLKKLNIFKNNEFYDKDKGRLIFQAFKSSTNEVFQLSSLTPNTSFRLKKGTGIADERKLIWTILTHFKVFKKGRRSNGLKLALSGSINKDVGSLAIWKTELDNYGIDHKFNIRSIVFSSYKKAVSEQLINVEDSYFKSIKNELHISGIQSLQKILVKYSEKLNVKNTINYKGPIRLLSTLRRLLTNVCVDFIEADLYILDEFQRFKDLIGNEGEKESEASLIAKEIFSKTNAKVLMLSATPFKPFTNASDAVYEEDHHQEFKKVLSFLLHNDIEKLEDYEINRKRFFDLLRRPENLKYSDLQEKKNLESLYRSVLSRTERLLVSDDKNTLLKDFKIKVAITTSDISNFVESDRILKALMEVEMNSYHSIIPYSKSAPFPLSFMDNYKVKDDLKEMISKSNKLKEVVLSATDAWLDFNKISQYKSLGIIPNPSMRELMKHAIENGMYKLLWIPPSLAYYKSEGSFENMEHLSKVLVFSKWKMVPRAIASLVSYEAERRTIGNKELNFEGVQYTPDFSTAPNDKKKRLPRKPGKLLAFKMKDGKAISMSIFNLMYPSLTLANIYHPKINVSLEKEFSLSEIKEHIKLSLKEKINNSNLNSYKFESGKTQNWYWAAPLLLDKFYYPDIYNKWFEDAKSREISISRFKKSSSEIDEEKDEPTKEPASLVHMRLLHDTYLNPQILSLGEFPDDLFDVLALQTIGSAGILNLRILLQNYPDGEAPVLLNKALEIGFQFHSLFDKPESIAAVKLSSLVKKGLQVDEFYWKEVLNYCADGNLQSVMDEFAHLIIAESSNLEEFTNRISNTANIRTSNLTIDNANSLIGENVKDALSMRCHYAVDFGNQNMDKEEGINRVKSILENFNSPFRPFVLASTSLGQEGLDFHFYCRKVMHWNLPSNPIDIEQREGRVNRFKGLVVRQNLVKKYKHVLKNTFDDYWLNLFDYALNVEGKLKDKPELVPYWHIEPDGIFIERIIPLIPFSKEVAQLGKLLSTLALYRLTFGQPRQEELIESLYKEYGEDILNEVREKLLINLSPITYKRNKLTV